jgi:hypothetical protein
MGRAEFFYFQFYHNQTTIHGCKKQVSIKILTSNLDLYTPRLKGKNPYRIQE